MTDNLENPEAPEKDNPQNPEQDQGQEPNDELTKERYKQQIEGSKAEAQRLREMLVDTEVQKATNDGKSLLELHSKDPKLAKTVADKMDLSEYGGYENFLKNKGQLNTPKSLTEDDFEKLYQERKQKEDHDAAVKKADKIIKKIKDESLQEKANAYFKKLTEGRTLNEESALEYADMATLYVNKDQIREGKLETAMEMLGSTGLPKAKAKTDSGSNEVIIDGKLVTLNSKKQ